MTSLHFAGLVRSDVTSPARKPLHTGQRLAVQSRQARPSPHVTPPLLALLKQQALFELLPEHLLVMLASTAQIRRYTREACIVEQDRTDSALYLLLRGRAHAERTGPNGRQVLLSVLEAGARIAEMNLLDGLPHNATVRCVLPCEVLVLRGEDVLNCQAQCTPFSQAWMADLVGRLRDTNRRITSMSLHGVRERVMWQLREWSRPDAQGVLVVSSRVGRSELARIVGASREMVCRVLRSLQDEGALALRSDRSIALADQPAPTAPPDIEPAEARSALNT